MYALAYRNIGALVSDMAAASLVVDTANALAHQAVVQAAIRLFPAVIPCRFGMLLVDDAQLLGLMHQHYAACEAELARLAGQLEVGVQAIFYGRNVEAAPALESPGLTEGARYLLAKKRHSDASSTWRASAEEFAHACHTATAPWWTEVQTQQRRLEQGLLLSLGYLVPQDQVTAFRQAYEQFRQHTPQRPLLLHLPLHRLPHAQIKVIRHGHYLSSGRIVWIGRIGQVGQVRQVRQVQQVCSSRRALRNRGLCQQTSALKPIRLYFA
ncbi:MAG: GvpL/GvpF family gas vesicle protein [Candidatus Hydrogenedentes bacterium]|nr:GvpL/GvpF family gas vesicle protein [Candidatus Hydrogenedentota bacterium]